MALGFLSEVSETLRAVYEPDPSVSKRPRAFVLLTSWVGGWEVIGC